LGIQHCHSFTLNWPVETARRKPRCLTAADIEIVDILPIKFTTLEIVL